MGQRTQLANYGIHTEQSDWRVHVCVLARKVYVFAGPLRPCRRSIAGP